MSGWIKLHRKFVDWEWFYKSEMVHIFLFLLLSANHKGAKWQGIEIKRGQLITGLKKLNKKTGISLQKIRTCLKKLENTNEIIVKSTNKFSIITICKYDSYQIEQQTTNKQLTNKQQTTNKQLTTNKKKKKKKKNDNNDNNEKNNKTKKHFFKDSKYFDIKVLKAEINDKYKIYDIDFYYESMLNAAEIHNYKYANWLAVCRNWINRDIKNGKVIINKTSVNFVYSNNIFSSLSDEKKKNLWSLKKEEIIRDEEWITRIAVINKFSPATAKIKLEEFFKHILTTYEFNNSLENIKKHFSNKIKRNL